jgi:3-phosphoshikimate 1-carboxyvinyltransferase
MRPLTAALALLGGDFELSGVPRMHERPIGDLVDALRSSAAASTTSATPATRRCASARSIPSKLVLDAPIRVRGDVSSQFLTALLLALPLVARERHRHRGRRRADLQALHRDHPEPAGALRHRGAARWLGALHHSGRQPLPLAGRGLCRGRCLVGQLFHRTGRHRRGHPGPERHPHRRRRRRIDPGRHPLHRRRAAMGAQVDSGPNWLEVRRGAWPLKAIDLDATTSPTPR